MPESNGAAPGGRLGADDLAVESAHDDTALSVAAANDDLPPLTNRGGQMPLTVLRSQLDWLEYHSSGGYWSDGESRLDSLVSDEPRYDAELGNIRVSYCGGRWRYLLQVVGAGVDIRFNALGCQTRFGGTAFTVVGADEAERLASAARARFGSYAANDYPTRCDFAVDFAGFHAAGVPSFTADRKGRNPLPTLYGLDGDAGTWESLRVGKSGKGTAGISIQVYNKSIELESREHSQRYHDALKQTWALNGWDGVSDVHRWEVQVTRERLKANGLTVEALLADSTPLVALGTGWVTPNPESSLSDLWALLGEYLPPLDAVVAPSRVHALNSQRTLRAAYSALCRYAAEHNYTNLEDSLVMLSTALTIAAESEWDFSADVNSIRKRYGMIPIGGDS